MTAGSKPATQSLTIISIIASLLFLILGQYGVDIAEPDRRAIVEALSLLASAGAQCVAIYGRVRANKKIGPGRPHGGTAVLVAVMIVAALSPLAACAPAPAPAVNARATLADDKALLALETSFHIAVTVTEQAVDAGELTGPRAASARRALGASYRALKLARAAYDAGDAATYTAQSMAALALLGEAQSAFGRD